MISTVFHNREDRIRTCDPLVPNQVLYQAELLPGYEVKVIKDYRIKKKLTCTFLKLSQSLNYAPKGVEPLTFDS